MKIGIDVDDTITDTFDYLMPYVAEFFGADYEELKSKRISYSNLPLEWLPQEKEFGKKFFDKVVPHTPIKPFAVEVIKRLRAEGHEIYIITARDNSIYTDAYLTTSKQLKNSGIEYDRLIYTFDKSKACREEKIDLFLDDSIANCMKAYESGVKVLLFNSPANARVETVLDRVNNWEEVYVKISEEMK